MNLRLLTKNDWKLWKQIRLDALKNAPENFGSSFEEESNWSDLAFPESLVKNDIFGVFVNGEIVACAGFYILDSLKVRHRGVF